MIEYCHLEYINALYFLKKVYNVKKHEHDIKQYVRNKSDNICPVLYGLV